VLVIVQIKLINSHVKVVCQTILFQLWGVKRWGRDVWRQQILKWKWNRIRNSTQSSILISRQKLRKLWRTFMCKFCRFLFVFLVIGFVGVEIVLVWFFFEYYVWIVPGTIFLNLTCTWLFVNRVLFKILLFPYSLSIVKYMHTQKLNQ